MTELDAERARCRALVAQLHDQRHETRLANGRAEVARGEADSLRRDTDATAAYAEVQTWIPVHHEGVVIAYLKPPESK